VTRNTASVTGGAVTYVSTPWALRLHAEGPLEIYYGPFEHVNTAARLVVVGITPSKTETVAAFERLARALNDGLSRADALRCDIFPHPSGANARRYEQFRAVQPTLRQAVADWFAPRISAL